jgi:hypothetical protein
MQRFVIAAEEEYDRAVAAGSVWCRKCERFVEGPAGCSRCLGIDVVGAVEAKEKHLFIFAPDRPSFR